MKFKLRVVLLGLLCAQSAYAAEGVVEAITKEAGQQPVLIWLLNLLFAGILGLVALTYRTHVREYEKYKEDVADELEDRKKEVNNRFEKNEIALALNIRKEDAAAMQASIHASIQTLRAEITTNRLDDSNSIQRTLANVLEDLKEQRREARRLHDEMWRQIEDTREKMNNFQIALARTYHTKEEMADILSEKIDPIMDELKSIRNTYINRRSN